MSVSCVTLIGALFVVAVAAEAVVPAAKELPTPQPGEHERIPRGLAPAIQALRKNDAATALSVARKFIQSEPTSSLGHEVLGEAATRQRQWQDAEAALAEALRLDPKRITARLRLGLVALATRSAVTAEEQFRQAIIAAPTLSTAHHGLALALAAQGKLAAAISAAEHAVKLAPAQNMEAKTMLAGLYHDAGRLLDAERVLTEVLAAKPDHDPARLLQGIVALDLGRTDEASALFEQVAIRNPKSLWARLGRALVRRARGQLAHARAELEQIVKENADWSLARAELGRTLLLQGEHSAALKTFDEAERASSDRAHVRLRSTRLLLRAGQIDAAIERARSLLADAAIAPAARDVLVQAYLARKAPEEAERVLREAADAATQDPVPRLQLGQFYLARSRPKDGLAEFDRAAALRPDSSEALRGKAQAHAALGEAAAAIGTAERLVKIQGSSPEAHLFLASIQQAVGRPSEAARTLREVLAKHPQHLGVARALAAVYDRDGQPAEAVKVLQEAAKVHPQSPVPAVDLAALLQRHGQYEAAVTAYREGLARTPEEPALLNNLAYLLARTPATLAEAATLSERAYAKMPRNPAFADTRGWILVQQGAAQRGLPLLEEAARLAPTNPTIRYHLGVAYAKVGKPAEARRALQQALQTPQFEDAEAARKLLDSLP